MQGCQARNVYMAICIAAAVVLLLAVDPYQRAALGLVWDTARGIPHPLGPAAQSVPNPPDAGTVGWPGYGRFCMGTLNSPSGNLMCGKPEF